jgi:acyl carrier protein phosphodiesterase
MNTTIMSADDLIRYAKPQTDLESALMDALAEALESVNELADILSVLADHDMTPQTMEKDLDDAQNRYDALEERFEALENERDILTDALQEERTRSECS